MIYNGVLWFCCLCNLIFGESSLQLIEVLQLQLRISLPRLMSLILDPGQILIKWVWFQQSGCGQTTCVCTPPFLNSSPHQKKKKTLYETLVTLLWWALLRTAKHSLARHVVSGPSASSNLTTAWNGQKYDNRLRLRLRDCNSYDNSTNSQEQQNGHPNVNTITCGLFGEEWMTLNGWMFQIWGRTQTCHLCTLAVSHALVELGMPLPSSWKQKSLPNSFSWACVCVCYFHYSLFHKI